MNIPKFSLAVNRLPVIVWRPDIQGWVELGGAVKTWSVVFLCGEMLVSMRL